MSSHENQVELLYWVTSGLTAPSQVPLLPSFVSRNLQRQHQPVSLLGLRSFQQVMLRRAKQEQAAGLKQWLFDWSTKVGNAADTSGVLPLYCPRLRWIGDFAVVSLAPEFKLISPNPMYPPSQTCPLSQLKLYGCLPPFEPSWPVM